MSVTGLPWAVSLIGAEGANDRLTLNAQGGDDVINASALAAGLVSLTVNSGLGADVFIGSAGDDLVNGGDGNDTALLGAGNDVSVWNPGDDNDTIEGQAGTDTLRFNGADIAENITISPNGGRAMFFRDIASVTMDLNDTEVIQFTALGGADTIVVNDLSGTDVTQLAIDLASTVGGAAGDAQVDTLTLSASDGANTINLSGATGALLTVTGLPASVTISQFETSGTAGSAHHHRARRQRRHFGDGAHPAHRHADGRCRHRQRPHALERRRHLYRRRRRRPGLRRADQLARDARRRNWRRHTRYDDLGWALHDRLW